MIRAEGRATLALAGLLGLFWISAFIGLSTSSFWTDELFTLFVTDHRAGLGEVLRRALTDTHPPGYYFLLHLWIGLTGDGEGAVRCFSAICAVLAGAAFVACGRAFSLPGRLFGAVLGASSPWWFAQSQNGRSYGLAMLLSVILLMSLLEAKRRADLGRRVDLWLAGVIALTGFVAAFVHFYLLVQVGLLYLAALLTIRDGRFQLLILLAGVVTLGASVGYIVELRSHTLQDFHHLWFSNDPKALNGAINGAGKLMLGEWPKNALLLLLAVFLFPLVHGAPAKVADHVRQAPPLANWLAVVCLVVIVGAGAIGLTVSLAFAPSFSDLNLLVAQPCLWPLCAWLYDRTVSDANPRQRAVLTWSSVALVAAQLPILEGRVHPRNEDWRASAQLINGEGACRGREIPVVFPDKFGPPTAFYRKLAEDDFYGRYYSGGGRLAAWTPDEIGKAETPELSSLLIARSRGADPCPILAWGVHDLDGRRADELADALSHRIGAPVHLRRVPSYALHHGRWADDGPSAYIFERAS